LSCLADASAMLDPYDPPHPDGPDDPDDLPGAPQAAGSWLHDDEPAAEDWRAEFHLVLDDPA
jgi:hypothetical protein